jgi:aldose 1-epimerase
LTLAGAQTHSAVAPSGEQFELAHGEQRAVVVEVGAGLRSYSVAGRELIDGYAADELCPSGRGQVLAPWPNRLEDGSYEFDGRKHQLPLSEPATGTAIHGLVRWAAWRVREREPSRVVLEHLLHPQSGYPFSLALSLEYSLDEDGLSVRTSATNVGSGPCPYGSGAHPYLTVGSPVVDTVLLQVPARTVVFSDDRSLPGETIPVEGTGYDFRRPRPVGPLVLDNAFTDLERDDDGLARVELRDPDSDRSLSLWVDESYGYLMLFTGDPLPDVARRSLAAEPMTCPANAFRTGEALIRLEPGESTTGRWGISARS